MSERQVNKTPQETPIDSLDGVVCCPAGDRIAPVYKKVYDERLKKNVVKKVDEFDLYEFIQASKNSADLALLQKRWIELGELDAPIGFDGGQDMVNVPSNIHDVYKTLNDLDGAYNKLPDSLKAIFGSRDAYLNSLIDGSFNAIVAAAINKEKVSGDSPAPEVKDE